MGGELDLYGLGAEFAAGCRDWDIAEALGAGLGGRWFSNRGVEFFEQVLGWDHEEEVDDASEDQEVNDGGEEVAVSDLASVDVRHEIAEVGFSYDGSNQRTDDFFCQCGHDAGERSSDDDSDGQVDHVATQDEVAESLEHEVILLKGFVVHGTVRLSPVPVGRVYRSEF
jgi:hypothetical protein